jgi:diguanylate cyclase (GGDEF)-like protein
MCNSLVRILLAEGRLENRLADQSKDQLENQLENQSEGQLENRLERRLEDCSFIAGLVAQLPKHYQLEQVETYDAALKALVSGQYDICLMDVGLIDQRLIEAGRAEGNWAPLRDLELRHKPIFNGYETAIIFLTPDAEHLATLRASGIDFLSSADLTAPFLEQAIHNAIERNRLRNTLHQLSQETQQLTITLNSLKTREERYRLAFQGSHDGVWDWNLETNEVLFLPERQLNLDDAAEFTSAQLSAWFECIHPQDQYWVNREITAHLDGLTPRFEGEYRMLHPDGSYRWMLTRGRATRNARNQAIRLTGIQIDVTDLKRAEAKRVHGALYDTLTGLPNRLSLMERLQDASDLASRKPEYLFAVLFIDLDRFKMINDSLGHAIGDQLLSKISARLSHCLRPCDTIARLGGDEFVVLLEDMKTRDNAIVIAKRILREVSAPFTLDGHEIFTSASIGITFSSAGVNSPENLLRDADLAMYRAKTQGRGRYEIFHPRMHSSAVALLQMETDLRHALEREELKLYYQPIIALRTNRLVGFEALIRWQHPQEGLISPAEFVPIAEETGLIASIGWWILREACTQMRQWQQQFPDCQSLSVNVNLSSKQFTPLLVEGIRQILAETGLEAQYLKLEITESVLMSHAESAIATLTQLKQLGIRLAIDDFGTGYSSLSYLHRFPIDTLKVDRSFICRVDVDGEQLAIVRTIITLAWNLGMEVVAEGVETPKQLAQIRSLRCEYAQGYLFSRPQDVQTIETLLIQELADGHFPIADLPQA